MSDAIDFAQRVTRWSRKVSNDFLQDRTTVRQRCDAYGDSLLEADKLLSEAVENMIANSEEAE